ncbi:hypothetical protein V6N11_035067 [Hibiscus sabdariffa]|uniref:aspartate carbamoyltransferase n=1 Tax=Hibiscus sabdariffa TaxID=183260 RepID=A0ABR1ZG69_9ROSI
MGLDAQRASTSMAACSEISNLFDHGLRLLPPSAIVQPNTFVLYLHWKIFPETLKLLFSSITMASSTLFSMCSSKRESFDIKAINSNKEFKFNTSNLLNSLPVKAMLSSEFMNSRLLTDENSLKWGQSERFLRNRMQCHAVPAYPMGKKFQLDDVIEAQQFDRETLNAIFEVAKEMETIKKNSPGSQILKGYLMATLFYEPSTRTRLSFESAMKRLGGEVLTTENAREFSSAAKGETLEDTIRTVEGYSDIIVMRHFESGAAKRAAATAGVPIINAGDGPGQHPTQALLDVYTIEREIGKLDGIRVGLVGDLANGRTVRSLAYLLTKYQDVKIYFVSPNIVKMKDDIKDYLTSRGVEWEESADLMEVASKCDVVYQTRIQRERFGERIDLYEEARGKYIVDKGVLKVMQKHAVVMHPLPRLDEITVEVDADPRAAYFRQAKNGLYIRMALLKLLLVGW